MTTLEALVLGIVQGMLGFLPVDPDAHAHLVWRGLFGHPSPAPLPAMDLFRIGSSLAVLVVLRADVKNILARRPLWIAWLILGTVPLAVFGFKTDFMRQSSILLPWGLLVMGGVLWALARSARPPEPPAIPLPGRMDLTASDVLLVGLAHVAALCPGISRLGLPYACGVACGLDRRTALVFSLLLLLPTLAFQLAVDAVLPGHEAHLPAHLVVIGIASAFSTALMVAGPFLDMLERASVGAFSFWLWIFAALAIFIF